MIPSRFSHVILWFTLVVVSTAATESSNSNKEPPWTTLDRQCLPKDGRPRFPYCHAEQLDSPDSCLVEPPSPDTNARQDLYSNALDMLALSQYIYEIVELRRIAKKEELTDLVDQLQVSPEKPKSLAEMQSILRENLDMLYKDGDINDAVETLAYYLNASSPVEVDLAQDTVKGGRKLVDIADSPQDVSTSRVHAIVVNDRKKRVEVVFRGTTMTTFQNTWRDWSTNLNGIWKRSVDNHVVELKDKIPKVNLHRGFAKVLLGDAGDTPDEYPYEEILSKVKSQWKDGYRLYVTGHSLGGAIATLFGYYAAGDSVIHKSGPVTLYTYASPRVGGTKFRKVFSFLEQRGRLRHARIHNQNDKVAQMPYFGGTYKHVGMELRLRFKDRPVVDYPVTHSWVQDGTLLINRLWTMKEVLTFHTCKEMLRRLQIAKPALNVTTLENEYRKMWGI